MLIQSLLSIFVTIPVLVLCQHCGPQQHSPETTIDQDSTDVVVLSEIKDTTQKKCFKSCCSILEKDGCNAVVYQHSSKRCTLIKCQTEAGCLLKPDKDFVTTSIGVPINASTTTTSLSNSTVTDAPNDAVDSTTTNDEIIKTTDQTGDKKPTPTLNITDGDDTTTVRQNDAPTTTIKQPGTEIQSETTSESTIKPELTTTNTFKDITTFTTTPSIRNTSTQSTSFPPTSPFTTILSSESTKAFSTSASLSETATSFISTSANSRTASESLVTTTSNALKQTESSITMPSTVTLSTLSSVSTTSKESETQRTESITNSSVNTNQPEITSTISETNTPTVVSNTSSLFSNKSSNGTDKDSNITSTISSVFPPSEASVVSTQPSQLMNETSHNHAGLNITTAANINTNSSMGVNNTQSDIGQQTHITTGTAILNTSTTSKPEAHTTPMNVSEQLANLPTSEVTMNTHLVTTEGPSTRTTTGLNTESSNASSRVSPGKHLYASQDDQLPALLIAALSIGIVFVFAVFVLLGKRVFDSWQRRHYSRVDYLINGMYN